MKIIRIALTAFLTTFSALVNADISEAFHTIDITSPLPPVRAEDVFVHTYLPKSNYKIIGKIYARGMAEYKQPNPYDIFGTLAYLASPPKQPTEQDDIDLAMNALAEDAAKIGANGVLIVSSQQIQITNSSSERRISAIAFRINPPNNLDKNIRDLPAASWTHSPLVSPVSNTCQTSADCRNAKFCFSGRCETPKDYSLIPQKFPTTQSSTEGQFCVGDEHCVAGLYCSHKNNRCAARHER